MNNHRNYGAKIEMKDDNKLALIKRVQEKEKAGWEPVCKITKKVNTRYDNGQQWCIVMRKVV